jgi:hypothetical protein
MHDSAALDRPMQTFQFTLEYFQTIAPATRDYHTPAFTGKAACGGFAESGGGAGNKDDGGGHAAKERLMTGFMVSIPRSARAHLLALRSRHFDQRTPYRTNKLPPMNNLFRGLLAGGAAAKWGGGCFGTVIVFVIVYMLLGSC